MKILRLTLRLAAVAAALAVGGTQLAAQTTTGSIGGRVINATGQGVDNAQIQVVNGATGLSVGANTRTDGNFVIVGLEIGDQYRVTVRRIGFAPQTVQPVRVTLGQTTPVNFTLSAQAAQLQTVTIEAAAENAIIAPSQKGSSTTITDTLLRKLPTLNRSFTDFVQLTPQVSTSGPGLSGAGVNNRYNNIQIDGATEKDLFGLGSTGQPGGQAGGKSIGLESVKEYQVLLAPYDVRVGNFSGLSVNAVTKSGTNDFHGSAYVFQRNDDLQRKETYLGNFYTTQYGMSLGGPILKDKVFFFVNPEFQKKAVPASGLFLGDGSSVTTAPTFGTSVDQFKNTLTNTYGLKDLGDAGKINNNNPLSNVFARLDIALPFNSTLVLRDNYAHAEQQVFSRGTTGNPFALTDNAYEFTSEKNAPVAQLRTNFTNGSYNELIAAYTRIRDKRGTPGTLQPQIDVQSGSLLLRAGTENSSQANALDQDILELTDNYTIPIGSSHRLTVGATGQWYKVRNLFGQNSVGYWTFNGLDSLALGRPSRYQVSVPVPGTDGAVRFKAGQFAGYLQDDYTATPNLNFSFGVRFDNPVFFSKPTENPTIVTQFGRSTADVPSGNLQVSPRIGFNWNVTGDSKNQVRGGLGMFQGAPAYVWLANSFQNSGGVTGFAALTCTNAATSPQFTAAAVTTPPTTCSNGTGATAGSEVDLLRKDLKFPQTLRGNLAYDRDIGHGYVLGVEGIYTKFVNSLFYSNIALQDAPIGTGLDGRALYGTLAATPQLKVTGRTQVYDVRNESKDYSYSFTGQLQKRFTTNFGGSIAYTYTQAYDVQGLSSSTAASQWGFGRQYAGDQNELNLSHSLFETPHRIIGNASYTFTGTGTSLSMIYTGQSGLNFNYVPSGDLNGDGRTGNDLLYIPTGLTDPKFPVFGPNGNVTASQADQATAFNNYISSQDCLNSQRGTIMKRNSCRTPWTNEFDVSVEQGIQPLLRSLHAPSALRGEDLSLRLDVINFGNLLNKNWGRQITTSNFSPVTLYTQRGIVTQGTTTATTLDKGVPLATFNPTFTPFTYANVFSNYGMQVSLRYAF